MKDYPLTRKVFFILGLIVCSFGLFDWLVLNEFNVLCISGLTMIFIAFNKNVDQHQVRITEPLHYVHFKNGVLTFGEIAIPTHKINKVALDVVDDDCYFSLPFNPTSPGNVPGFIFPAHQRSAFKQHLAKGIPEFEVIP